MKKILLTCMFLSLFTLVSQAQLRFGVKGGANLSGLSGKNIGDVFDKNMTSFHIGPSAEFMVAGKIGLEASLLYSEKGIKLKKDDEKHKKSYLELPLNLKYRISSVGLIKPYITAGPYINFKISGSDNFETIKDGVETQWKAKSFGAGLNFGAGIDILHFVQIGANYGLGLTENYKVSNGKYSVKESIWSITTAVYF